MMIQLELGPEFQKVLAELSVMGAAIATACSEGLEEGVTLMAHHVGENYLTGQVLKARKGDLRRAVQGWMEGEFDGVVGVKPNSAVSRYAYLLGDEPIPPITPKNKLALTIPIGEALTAAGVSKYESVKDAEQKLHTKIFRLKGKNVLGYKVGKKGKFRALFVLVKSVLVQPTGALNDGVLDKVDAVTEDIRNRIDGAIGN